MSDIGPFGKVSFTNNASIGQGPDGSVVIKTGDDFSAGAQYRFNTDGSVLANGNPIGSGGDFATKGFVQDAVANLASKNDLSSAIQSATQNLVSQAYVDQKVSTATQGSVTQQYVLDTIQAQILKALTDGQKLEVQGYQRFLNGLTFQWGIVTVQGGTGFTWTYPTAFQHGVFCVLGNGIAGSTGNTADRTVQPVGPGQASCTFSSTYNGGGMPGPTAHMLFAIGY